ncbi:MAG: DMT family transporter [Eubacteriaceae bacterium]|nr:DMT family transporter [Eubacteriaceae bacterium]
MEKKQARQSKAALLIATLIWGYGFVAVKNAINEIGPFYLLFFRFSIAGAVLSIAFFRKFKLINKDYAKQGIFLGVLLFSAYAFQTVGIVYTTPGKNAFLTAVYCVLVPFIYWAVEKSKPAANHFFAAAVCLAGIWFVSSNDSLAINIGDLLTLICGVFYALHVVFVGRFARTFESDAILLTILQFITTAALSLAAALVSEPWPSAISPSAFWPLMYLALPGTAIALLFQVIGQKHTHPAPAAIIMSLEGVFGVIFSLAYGMEKMSLGIGIGFVLIFAAEIVAQL